MGAREFRESTSRMNFLSLDCPVLQLQAKQSSREIVKPNRGSWKRMVAGYLINMWQVVFPFKWQVEPRYPHTPADIDSGGISNDRNLTSASVWMRRNNCIKTWGAPQGAFARSTS